MENMVFSHPTSSKSDFLQPGQKVVGRWNHRTYHVLGKIGKGANGEVYLVELNGHRLALKISADATNIALEYQVLREMSEKVQGISLGPFVLEMDDFEPPGGEGGHTLLFFYVMEYVEGVGIESFLQKNGSLLVGALILQLLSFLAHIHEHQVAFGDLKAENLLVHPQKGILRVIDFGGVTPFGKGIRQYTAWYDRAHWGMGARRADEAYDLFAVAMLMLRLCKPGLDMGLFVSADVSLRWKELMTRAKRSPEISIWWPILERAWAGRYKNAWMMHSDVERIQKRIMMEQLHARTNRTNDFSFMRFDHSFFQRWDMTDWALLVAILFTLSVFVHVFVTF
jgi:serine/threonine protein kinase, bacterial